MTGFRPVSDFPFAACLFDTESVVQDDQDQIARHRMIYEALGPLMQREIHALAIRALTPDEL